jgi:hypothetical protein
MSSDCFCPDYLRSRQVQTACFEEYYRPIGSAVGWGCPAVLILLVSSSAPAQEALRDSLTGEAAAEARQIHLESLPYTVKSGDFRLLATPWFGVNWNGNVNISKTDPQSDVILEPGLNLVASYPITQNNLLSLNVGVGYQKYIEHNQYSTWYLQSGTELSFDIYVKDFWINLHDRISYVQDTSQQPELSGTATYATIDNTVGASGTWDLNELTLSTGYDHENVIANGQQFAQENRGTEMLFARGGWKIYPGVTPGIEGTAAFTAYQEPILNNNNNYSLGAYIDWQPGKAFDAQLRGGYTIYRFQQTSQTVQTSNQNTWYVDLNITHQITDAINYSLDGGHELQLGITSDLNEDWYVRLPVRWNIVKNLNLSTSLSYQHGTEGVGNVVGNTVETYDWFGAEVDANIAVMKRLSVGLSYRLTLRSSDVPTDEYTQNSVGITFTYVTP